MPIVKYIIQTHFIDGKINRFEYERETKEYLFIKGGMRTRKNTSTCEHYSTWEGARDRLIELQSAKVARLQVRYNKERKKFTKIMELKDAKSKI